jgi:hypothetical protein
MGTKKSGGEKSYFYDFNKTYTSEELKELAPEVIETQKRDPHIGKLNQLFKKGMPPIKRVGIIVFETQIQPTRSGLAGDDLIYLSPAGKQILTENFLNVWEESISLIAPELDYVPTNKLKQSQSFQRYGLSVNDRIKSPRSSLSVDDIFFIEKGKKTTTDTVINPRGMRDMSFLLVPATEMMGGPKWSEHNKHFVNDVAKELNLDAVVIIMSKAEWTTAHVDKHTGISYREELTLKIEATTLIPLFRYHERLAKLHINEKPNITLAYRTYSSTLLRPIAISVEEEKKNFSTIQTEILAPLFKTYKDLSQMTMIRLIDDMKKTW